MHETAIPQSSAGQARRPVTVPQAQPELRAKLVIAGLEVIGNSPQEFAAQIKEEIVRKGKLVKFSGAKPD